MKFKVEVVLKKKSMRLPAISDFQDRVKRAAKHISTLRSLAAFSREDAQFEAVVTVNELAPVGLAVDLSRQAQALCLVVSRMLSGADAEKTKNVLYAESEGSLRLEPAFPGATDQCSTFTYSNSNIHVKASRIGKAPTKVKLADPLIVKLSEAGQLIIDGLVRTSFTIDSGSLDQFRCGEKEKDVQKFFTPVTELLHEARIYVVPRASGCKDLQIHGIYVSRNREEALDNALKLAEAVRKLWAPAYAGVYKSVKDNIDYMREHGTKHMRVHSVSVNMDEIPKIAVLR